jgi:hypothetical protein
MAPPGLVRLSLAERLVGARQAQPDSIAQLTPMAKHAPGR